MIVVELMGGLGNQMFQHALARHLAIKNKAELVFDIDFLLDRSPRENFVYRDFDLGIFNIQENFAYRRISKNYGTLKSSKKNVFEKLFIPRLKYIREERFDFNPEVLESGNNIYLHGYWQSEKYFKQIESTIRQDFTFKSKLSETARLIGDRILASNAVCVNVRRGDFLTNPILGTVGINYYNSAINYLTSQVLSPTIFVFSDEIEWCRENLKFDFETVYVSHEYAGEKFKDYLQLMILCKHFIIPNSSFAWWAAWLCANPDKIVIAPEVWFQSGNWNYQDILPEKWIKL